MQILPISALFCFFSSVHFSRIIARIFSPHLVEPEGSFSFFISVAYLRQFSPALFPFSSFFFYRQIVFAALLCPLRGASFFFFRTIPSSALSLLPPLPPRKSHYSDFFKPQNLHISFFCIIFAPKFRKTSHPLIPSPTNPSQGLCPTPDTEWIETGKEAS